MGWASQSDRHRPPTAQFIAIDHLPARTTMGSGAAAALFTVLQPLRYPPADRHVGAGELRGPHCRPLAAGRSQAVLGVGRPPLGGV